VVEQKNTKSQCERLAIDTRLIAALQTRGGARSHEAANLIHCYLNWAACHQLGMAQADNDLTEEARQQMQVARTAMRRFLSASAMVYA